MKEALERMDSGLLFAASGRGHEARAQFDKSKEEFDRQLAIEQGTSRCLARESSLMN